MIEYRKRGQRCIRFNQEDIVQACRAMFDSVTEGEERGAMRVTLAFERGQLFATVEPDDQKGAILEMRGKLALALNEGEQDGGAIENLLSYVAPPADEGKGAAAAITAFHRQEREEQVAEAVAEAIGEFSDRCAFCSGVKYHEQWCRKHGFGR